MAKTGRVIELPYSPRRVFYDYHARTERWAAMAAHRRAGKTVACVNDLIARALSLTRKGPPGRYAYVAPYLSQAKEIAWGYLKTSAMPAMREKNESELWVDLINGARIRLHGADNPDRIRGAYLDGVVLDEFADMRPSIFGEVIRPMLADYAGWATFIGTPKGRNVFFDMMQRAQGSSEWFSAVLKASETGILPAAELVDAARDMTPEQYAQEFECSFDAAILGAYYGKDIAEIERQGRIGDVPHDPALKVYTAWDLGIGDATAIWFFQVVGPDIHVIDHYEAYGQGLPHYAAVLGAKGYAYARHYVPHDARARDLGTGRTRVETMKTLLGRFPDVLLQNDVMDGINAARLTLPRCRFDAIKCADGLEMLRQYRAEFDEKTRAFRNQPRHDFSSHTSDAFRYLSMAWRQLVPAPPPPQPKFDYGISGVPGMPFKTGVTITDLIRRQERRERDDD
jgi:phage terminase large subunit